MHQESPLKTNATHEQQSGWLYLYRETFRSESNSAHRTLSRSKHRGVSTPVAGPVARSLLMLEEIYTRDCTHDKTYWLIKLLVDLVGIEPTTSSMPWKRA